MQSLEWYDHSKLTMVCPILVLLKMILVQKSRQKVESVSKVEGRNKYEIQRKKTHENQT
jgi:hypothetical protein